MAIVGIEVVIVAVVALAVFFFGGPKAIGWAKTLGQAKKAFEDAAQGKDPKEEKE